jgi:3-dehydroquinate dehydratase/shikimate dehydrogenase
MTTLVAILAGTPARVRADLAALAARSSSLPAEVAAEVRLDLMDPPDPAVCAGAPLPVVATCRRPRDGGRYRGGEAERLDLLRRAAAAGARWVDVEADVLDSWSAAGRAQVVASLHDFEATPPDLPATVGRLLGAEVALVKVATRTRSLVDLMTLAAAVRQAPGRVIAVGMGQPGAASRVLADRIGSAWMYVRGSGPGTPALAELEDAGVPALDELVVKLRGGTIDARTPAFAVVGDRADESIGPAVFNRVFRELGLAATYVHLKTPALAGLREACRLLGIRGVSVTTPFKELVLAAADRVDSPAREAGAANTLVLHEGAWVASNTDGAGAKAAVQNGTGWSAKGFPQGLSALVVGAGGMGRAACVALRESGCRVALTSRGADRLRRAAQALGLERIEAPGADSRKWDILVNATPAGSLRDLKGQAVDPAWAVPGGIVVETNYRPLETPLVRRSRELGLTAVTGDVVYVGQALEQLRLFLPGQVDGARPVAALASATRWALDPNASS